MASTTREGYIVRIRCDLRFGGSSCSTFGKDLMLMQGNFTHLRFVIVLFLGTCAVGCKQTPAGSAPPPPKVEVDHPILREITDEDAFNGWLQASVRRRGPLARARLYPESPFPGWRHGASQPVVV